MICGDLKVEDMFSSCLLMFFFGSLANLCRLTMTCDILPQFISREGKLVDRAKEVSSWRTESGWLSGAFSTANICPSQNRFATEVLFLHQRGYGIIYGKRAHYESGITHRMR